MRSSILGMRCLCQSIRHQSTKAAPPLPPPEITSWINSITNRSPEISSDLLDAQRAAHLQRTIPTRVVSQDEAGSSLSLPPSSLGEVLPKGHHLAYFHPQSLLNELGEDGSSTEYNAPAPYLRRMWAGGSFQWSADPVNALRIGEPVTQLNSVSRAEFKAGMIFVHQQRDLFRGEGEKRGEDFAVREVRTHVFRQEVTGNDAVKTRAKAEAAAGPAIRSPSHTITYTPTPPLLFRFSALTYNAHRIHYDRDWTRLVENHPNLVVHGPLTALLLVELSEKVAKDIGKELRKFEYRATSPMYVDEEIRLAAGADSAGTGGKVELVAEQAGRVGMRATAIFGS